VGSNIHGQGGWQGWNNDPNVGGIVTDTTVLEGAQSLVVNGVDDPVRPFEGYTTGMWTFTAHQYIPADTVGATYFIMLNQYLTIQNWSVQVMMDNASGMVINEGASGGVLDLITDEWVEIRVEIDLDADTQSFYYGGSLLYTGSWTGEVSGGGIANIGAVDLWSNGATDVFYDDLSLAPPAQAEIEVSPEAISDTVVVDSQVTNTLTISNVGTGDLNWSIGESKDACATTGDVPWASASPISGTTPEAGSSDVAVTFDSTGYGVGVYTGSLCIESDAVTNPLVTVPLTMNVTVVPNDPPLAVDDAYTMTQDTTAMFDVLANDSDPDGDPLTITAVGAPANGTASTDGSMVHYTPTAGYSGTDVFTYTITDGENNFDTANVAVVIEPDVPTAITLDTLTSEAPRQAAPLVAALALGMLALGAVYLRRR
jgi:hypothetical protein